MPSSGFYCVNEQRRENESKVRRETNDLRGLKKLWKLNVTENPIIIGSLETVRKGLEKENDGIKIQRKNEEDTTSIFFKLARIWRRDLKTWSDFLSLGFQ